MARPRVIKLPNGGEILIKNGTPELVEQLRAVVYSKDTLSETPAAVQEDKKVVLTPATILPYQAVGISELNGEYFIDRLQYDPVMGYSQIVSHVSAGYDRGYAGERFKIAAAESDLV